MNILFTLCGRAGSKGVRGKNARDFLEVPLVWYSMAGIKLYIEKYVKPDDHVDVVLNTDSEDLIKLVEKVQDLQVGILRRDVALAGDKVAKSAVIKDCLKRAKVLYGVEYDEVVDLDITSPLRTVQDIKNVIDKKKERDDVNVVFSVTNSRRNPYFNMVKEENGVYIRGISSNFTTRQEAPVFYDMNASIYAYSPEALENKDNSTIFSRGDITIMFDTGILDIDSEEDYELMQVIAKYLFENNKAFEETFNKVINWK